jgi:DsbC/DsbD-like thiol-disulfide interchange protein
MIRGSRTHRRLAARGVAVVAIYGAALFVGSSATSAQTRIARADQGSVELILTRDAAGRDGHIEAGLRFRLQPGWHIYWRNPVILAGRRR